MRNFLFTLFFGCVLSFSTHATIFTVSADENHPAQFTTLQAAHDAASEGDTIHWYGAGFLGQPTISKRLIIIGSNSTYAYLTFTNGASGTKIIGGRYASLTGPGNAGILDLEFRNCSIWYAAHLSTGLTFLNCIINDLMGQNGNAVFSNCIFSNSNTFFPNLSDGNQNLNLYISDNCVIERCLFLSPLFSISSGVMLFTNCIFTAGFSSGLCFNSSSSFDTNMFVGFSVDDTQFCGTNIAPNNIMNAPDPFVNGSLTNLATINFDLNVASAGNNAALDGTDIGLYGGPNAWPSNFVNGLSAPGVPYINFLGLQNYVIGSTDPLNINAQGSIPSNE